MSWHILWYNEGMWRNFSFVRRERWFFLMKSTVGPYFFFSNSTTVYNSVM